MYNARVLEFDIGRPPVPPKDAATLVVVRVGEREPLEVFLVERSKQSKFMGGALVFPGGKVDMADAADEWAHLVTPPRAARAAVPFSHGPEHLRALTIACARETLEEGALLHIAGGTASHAELLSLRKELEHAPAALRTYLATRGFQLDLRAFYPLARWVTPEAESRRFDARFFVAIAPCEQSGAHDERETTSSFWGTPADVLHRYEAGEVELMPPTHRTLSLLSQCESTDDVIRMAESSNLDPICPRLVSHRDAAGETMALALPGDPEHEIRSMRVPGKSRYVLRGSRWCAEEPPR